MSFVISILILGFIIFIHEFGHFIFAKIFNVPVREFSIGMGKRIFSVVKNNTRYSLKILPLGGSCAMIGEDIAGSGDFSDIGGKIDEQNGTIDFDGVVYNLEEIKKNNFSTLNPIKKVIICFAGPLFNLLVAFICAFIVLMVAGTSLPVINTVVENSTAATATPYPLQQSDVIKEMIVTNDKETIYFDKDVVIFMSIHASDFKENPNLGIIFERDGKTYNTLATFDLNENLDKAVLGITLGANYKPNNIKDILYYTFNEGLFYIRLTIKSLKFLFSGKANANDISGPVGTVAVMGAAINSAGGDIVASILTILTLINLISSNLGIMNLLPIPALDGGRIIESAIEMIIGRPLDEKIISAINAVTMILLLLLMAYVFGMDIIKIFTGAFRF